MRAGCFIKFGASAAIVFGSAGAIAAAAGAPPHTLVPASPAQRALHAGQTHRFAIALTAGDLLDVTIAPRDIDVAAALLDPNGERIADVDTSTDADAPERVLAVAPRDGVYEIRVTAPNAGVATGRYSITAARLQRATDADASRGDARRQVEAGVLAIRTPRPGVRERTLERVLEARAVFDRAGDKPGACEAAHLIAWLEYDLQRQTAAASGREAEAACRAAGDLSRAIDAMVNRGLAELRASGGSEAAHATLAEALTGATGARFRAEEAKIRNALGIAYGRTGDAETAVAELRQALALAHRFRRDLEQVALNNLGIATKDLGDYEASLDYYSQTLAYARSRGDRTNEANALNNVGNLYRLLGEDRKALDSHEEALALAREVGNREHEARALNTLGLTKYKLGDYRAALDYHEQALAIRRQLDDPAAVASTLDGAAVALQKLGDTGKAFEYLTEALRLDRSVDERYAEADSLLHLARLERDRGDTGAALEQIAAAVKLTDSLRGRISNPDRRLSFVAAEQERYELYVDLLMQLDGERPGEGYAARAFEASERGRARVLVESLIEPRVESRLAHDNPGYAALTEPPAVSLEAVQRDLLDADTLLLEFRVGRERSWLWMLGRHSVDAIALPGRGELQENVRRAYAAIAARQPRRGESPAQRASRLAVADRRWRSGSTGLSHILLERAATRAGAQWRGKRLVFVADGALGYLPFGALPDPLASGRPLVEDHEIVNIPSAGVLSVIRAETERRAPSPRSLAIIADPVFDVSDPRVRRPAGRPASAGAAQMSRLPFSADEARAIAALVPGTDRLDAFGFDANRDTVTSGVLAAYRYVHFATHGVLDSAQPGRSGLVLSLVGRDGTARGGFLRLADVYSLKLPAELVVLSACDTALGKEIQGEGIIGLTRGFMYAGARRIVASLWQVDDLATAELMRKFYSGILHDHLRPAAALRAAQRALAADPRWQFPFYWSAFVLQGDWQ